MEMPRFPTVPSWVLMLFALMAAIGAACIGGLAYFVSQHLRWI